jgi:hypothetical protein
MVVHVAMKAISTTIRPIDDALSVIMLFPMFLMPLDPKGIDSKRSPMR